MPIFNYYPTATREAEIPDHYNNNNSFYSNYANNSSILASRQQPISYLHSHPIFTHNIWSDSFSPLPTQVGSSRSQSVPSLSSRSWSLYNHHSDSEDENEIEPLSSSSSLSDYSNALMIQKQQRQPSQSTSQLQRAQQPVEQQEDQSMKHYQQLQQQQKQQQEVSRSNNRQKEQESDEDDEGTNSKFRHLFHHHRRSPSRFFHRHHNHNNNNSNNNSNSNDKNTTKMRRVPIDEPIEQQAVSSNTRNDCGQQQFSISPKISPSQQQPPITTKHFENEKQQQTRTKSEEQKQRQNDDSHGIFTIDQFLSFTNKKIIHSKADGSCLFRSVSQALVQSQNKHRQVRELAIDWMRTHLDTLIDGAVPFRDSIFLKENQSNVQDYLRDMEVEGEWGDFSCIVALSHCLGVRFKIVVVQGETVTSVLDVSPQKQQEKLQEEEKDEDERQVIWLMFDEPRRHYNLIVNNQ